MTEWQERIDRATAAPIVAEHVLRYRFAAPLLAGAGAWVDLGCGAGLSASLAFGEDRPAAVLLVDRDADAVAEAAAVLPGAQTLVADLAAADGVERVAAAIAAAAPGAPPLITCFETLEHLDNIAPLVALLARLAGDGADVVLSVPNDAATGVENPFHATMWSTEAVAELRSQLPAEHVLAHQTPLSGSLITPDGADPHAAIDAGGLPASTPSHLLIAIGPRCGALAAVGAVEHAGGPADGAWERQREADLAYYRNEVAELEERLAAAELREAESRAADQ